MTIQCSLQLNGHTLLRTTNHKSILNLGTPSVGVSLGVQVPSSGFESLYKLRLCQLNHVTSLASRTSCVTSDLTSSLRVALNPSLEAISCCLRFLPHWCIVHSRLLPVLHSRLNCITVVTCTAILFNTFILINLTVDF
jgi:hypothetical protein